MWDAETGETKASLIGHTGTVFQLHLSPDDKHIVSCSFDRSVKVWEVREKVEMIGHEVIHPTFCKFIPFPGTLACMLLFAWWQALGHRCT